MLWKINVDLIDINNKNIMKQLYMKYKEVFEKEKANQKESKEDQLLKRKFDDITTINAQIHEITMIKQIKLRQELIKLEINKKNRKII